MPNDEAHQRIEELKKALYSRKGPPHLRKEGELSPKQYAVAADWKEDEGPQTKPPVPGSLFKKIFFFSLAFFVIAGFIAAFLFFKGDNVVSASNVSITILGPVSVGAGEELSLDIAVANKNSVDLQLTDLVITYPSGTRQASDTTLELPRERFTIGTIASGATIQKTIKAVLFGQQGDPKEMTVRVEYRLKDSNTVFFKEKKYQVAIESSPVSLAIDSLKEINSGQQLTMTLHLTSNSATLIKGLLVRAEFPFGFKLESATPKATSAQSVWSLGDIEAGGERTIKIVGTIIGQDNDERIFRFYTGTESPSDELAIGTVFIDTRQEVVVHKPFLGVAVVLDGDQNDPHISDKGDDIRGELNWTNNLASAINNSVIDMKVTGSALDKSKVTSAEGFYSSSDDTIEWSGDKNPLLVELPPGATGRVAFHLASLDFTDPKNLLLKNPQINLDVTVKGQRFSDTHVPELISSTLSRTIKIGAVLNLDGKISYSNGPFTNTGPIPPKADTPTTYTVSWKARGALNDIKNAYVTTKLPTYIKWVGAVSPSSAVIAYNPVTREVRWDIGDIPAGSGYYKDPKTVDFQVSFLPSVSQVGTSPIIINDMVLTGGDTFTSRQIVVNVQPLKAELKDEPNSEVDKGKVVR